MSANPLALTRDLVRCPSVTPAEGGLGLCCAVIVKHVDERTRSKTSINELLRD